MPHTVNEEFHSAKSGYLNYVIAVIYMGTSLQQFIDVTDVYRCYPEHGFCQQNGPERGQVQDWYPNEKMMVVFVCLNRCCSPGCVRIVSY